MGIQYENKLARLTEIVTVEDAEGLLEWLQSNPGGQLDLAGCTHLHAANLQVLLAARASVKIWPENEGLRSWLTSALNPDQGK